MNLSLSGELFVRPMPSNASSSPAVISLMLVLEALTSTGISLVAPSTEIDSDLSPDVVQMMLTSLTTPLLDDTLLTSASSSLISAFSLATFLGLYVAKVRS